MKLRLLLSLSLLLLVLPASLAQPTAEDIFHKGAQLYLDGITNASGMMNPTNHMLASQVVSNGLLTFPKNPYLTNLWELLNRSQHQQQNKSDQQKKDDQKKDSQQQEKADQKEQANNEQQAKQNEAKDARDDKKAQSEKKPGDKDEESEQARAYATATMTPKQAQQLLDALKSEEKAMVFTPPIKTNRTDKAFKDW